RHVRGVAVVEIRKRQRKLGAEFVERHLRLAGLREDKIRRLQNGGQIVHQRARPIEDDVANHEVYLTTKNAKNTKRNESSSFSFWSSSSFPLFDYENEDDD